ncbi:peptidylprolyl isomerase [Paenibacillus sp. NEAU-GSW1]|uniref:peptidylprolyl isomerase n=1 Tax=Paenibacillus sp. NEAU-GSW1 TaxID=2682486 RepID=UPI0020A6CA64|nr:peptidylprolyl isomerase [Paenibacillus sp. NEAU-GSW1]
MSKGKGHGWSTVIMLLTAAALFTGCGADAGGKASSAAVDKPMHWEKMPEMSIDLNKSYEAKFTTNKGDFTVKLFAKESPITVNNFVFLARQGFYDGLTFHRIIESFMIQGGDPKGTGVGNPGYSIPDELDTEMKYEPGIVAMANTGKPNTGGSQFFISTGPDSANLNQMPNYSIFGKVETGMETVLAIAKTPVKDTKPVEPVIIEKIVIEEV